MFDYVIIELLLLYCETCSMLNTFVSQTTLPVFEKSEFLVVRQHEEFIWLYDRFEENEDYAGYIVRT